MRLGRVPLMVLRGANSDLLSEETLSAMRTRHSSLEAVVVPDQGHAPTILQRRRDDWPDRPVRHRLRSQAVVTGRHRLTRRCGQARATDLP